MGTSIESQVYIFFSTLYGGIIIGFIYDLYRIFRYFSKPKKVATFIEDLVFWIIVALIALFILIFSNWGEIRGYVFLGFISGTLLYSKLLSKFVITLLVRLVEYLGKIIRYIFRVITYPFRLLGYKIGIPYRRGKKKVKHTLKRIKKIVLLPGRLFKDIKKHGSIILRKK